MRKILKGEIKLGEPLPWSVFDAAGNLLLRKGGVVNIERHLQILLDRGLYVDETPVPERPPAARPAAPETRATVFEMVDALTPKVRRLLASPWTTPRPTDLALRVQEIAGYVRLAARNDPDAALAAPQLDHHNPYLVVQHLYRAVICELVGKKAGLDEASRLSLVCAALTCDVGMMPIQTDLEKHEGPLTEDLRQQVRLHVRSGVQALRESGVGDPVWLEAILQHHERLDGGGYPDGLQGEAIGQPARLLAIADTYCAMCKKFYGQPSLTKDALRDIFLAGDSNLDKSLAALLVKEMTVFPPGTIVRLKNGEIAVVKRRQGQTPEAWMVYDKLGMPVMAPQRRDTTDADFGIVSLIPYQDCRSASLILKRVWTQQ